MSRFRIALGQLCCESNSFAAFKCDLETVRSTGYLIEGADLFGLHETQTEIAGALEALHGDDVEILPLIAAHWNSSSVVEADTYRYLKDRLLDQLRESGPVDGVFLAAHGAMVAEGEDDATGDLCAGIREIVGADVPVAITLDMHANVTELMVRNVDVVIGYRTYPHADARECGYRAAALLKRTILGDIDPHVALVRLPMIVGSFNTDTSSALPFARLIRQLSQIDTQPDILSASIFLVTPYIDVPDMGCSVVVVSNGNGPEAARVATDLARQYWAIRHSLLVSTVTVKDAVRQGQQIVGGPILLLDSADCAGGGAAADSVCVIRQLMLQNVQQPTLAPVVDPEAAALCHRAGTGSHLDLEIGHQVDRRWGTPLAVRGEVTRLFDGRFRYQAGIFGGTEGSMGPSAVVRIGAFDLLVQSRSTYDWGDEQFQAAGLDPATYKWVVVKNMMNFRHGYGRSMKAYFLLDCPGPTPPDRRTLHGDRAIHAWFPFDEELDPEPITATQWR